jgi:hypothetical protein
MIHQAHHAFGKIAWKICNDAQPSQRPVDKYEQLTHHPTTGAVDRILAGLMQAVALNTARVNNHLSSSHESFVPSRSFLSQLCPVQKYSL